MKIVGKLTEYTNNYFQKKKKITKYEITKIERKREKKKESTGY